MKWLGVVLGAFALAATVRFWPGTAAGESGLSYPSGSSGYDVSFPQCPSNFPMGGTFGTVGVTNGLPWSANPCLAAEYGWAVALSSPPAYYMNTANPGPASTHWQLPGPRSCADYTSYSDTGCAYNYGWNVAAQAFAGATNATSPSAAASHMWWLDIETANSWNGSPAANEAAIQGYLDYLNAQGVPTPGIYSTPAQWNTITGGSFVVNVPNWTAGASSAANAPSFCSSTVTGGPVLLVQYSSSGFNADYACAPATPTPTPTATSRTAGPTATSTATPTATDAATPTSTIVVSVGGIAEQPDVTALRSPAVSPDDHRTAYTFGGLALAAVGVLGAAGWYVHRKRSA
jgi:hypothetical protein